MLRYQEIKYQLQAMIRSMSPQEPLPCRGALCRMLDTTFGTLQKAMAELIDEGVIVSKAGSGTFVAGKKEEDDQQERTIGIILPNNDVDSYRRLLKSVTSSFEGKNVSTIVAFSNAVTERQNKQISRMIGSKVSGIILVPSYEMNLTKDSILLNRLTQYGIPTVFCFRGIDGLQKTPTVSYNNFYGGYLATKHLIQNGYRHIVYFERYLMRTGIDRYQGYVAAMLENGLTINHDAIVLEIKEDDSPLGYTDAVRVLTECPETDAIFCQADELIPGVYQAIADIGKRVSDDIGVIGFDDIAQYTMLSPPATTLAGKDEEIGSKAAKILWKMMNDEPVKYPIFVAQPEIIIRGSCLGPRKGRSGEPHDTKGTMQDESK